MFDKPNGMANEIEPWQPYVQRTYRENCRSKEKYLQKTQKTEMSERATIA